MNYRVSIVLEHDDAGYFAYSPELPGCYSQGQTYEDAVANIREAVDLYMETLDPEERVLLLSKQISTSSIEVAIA
jgi:predicted RNase H-like HicB family nuclease